MFSINKFYKLFLSSLSFILLVFSITAYGSSSIPLPTNAKYLNDYTGLLSNSESQQIISLGKELEDKTGAQAVITVISSTEGLPIEHYALNLFRNWGIGEKGKDNGLLILLAIEDKAWRVEVGRSLEGAIPDLLSSRIMDSIAKPSFIVGRYGEGLLLAYSVLCDEIANEYGATLDHSLNISLPIDTTYESNDHLKLVGPFIVFLLLLDFICNRGRISSSLLQILFLSNIGRRNGPRGGSGGNSGGGFGNFGGGSSNGGGSSGGW